MSDWNTSAPPEPGWYLATTGDDVDLLRYYSAGWSSPVFIGENDPKRRARARNTPAAPGAVVKWKGRPCVFPEDAEPYLPDDGNAIAMLESAAQAMRDRAAEYDRPEGERSMAATVVAFNACTGQTLTESQGWLFMELLKAVRDFTTPNGHADSQVDRVAYAALGAEARRAGR